MPTGYTADVQDGKIITLEQFAWQCARAFGALIEMRDDPQGAVIPERFKPDTRYHDAEIANAEGEIGRLEAMTEADADLAVSAVYASAVKARDEYAAEKKLRRERYETMLGKVRRWRTDKEIASLRDFMIEQLESSIRFDCSDHIYPAAPDMLSGAEWRKRSLSEARRSLARHKAEREKEIERVAGRNAWLAQLRADLADASA